MSGNMREYTYIEPPVCFWLNKFKDTGEKRQMLIQGKFFLLYFMFYH